MLLLVYARCAAAGTTFFLLKAAPYSASGRRQLLDAYGQPCIHMERKLTSLRGSWQLLRSRDGLQLAVVKPSQSPFTTSKYNYANPHERSIGSLGLGLCLREVLILKVLYLSGV